MNKQTLQSTIEKITAPGKGILAADESNPTIQKRFESIGLASTEDHRRAYRELLLTTPELNEAISGVILFEETLNQQTKSGIPFPKILSEQNILTGIKVDKGLRPLVGGIDDEKFTQGLDGLAERLTQYKEKGALFSKWRAVFQISKQTPSTVLIKTNTHSLARFAAICQDQSIVPIVEPEILIDGDHSLEISAQISEKVLHHVFKALYKNNVLLEYMILKPSMITPGKQASKVSAQKIAETTIAVFRRVVPAAVPTINFLSGGQTPIEATENLNALNQLSSQPWRLSFSFARALQAPCLKSWSGDPENRINAQAELLKRARLNRAAALGQYEPTSEI